MRLSSFFRQALFCLLLLPSFAFAETVIDRLSAASQDALMRAMQLAIESQAANITVEHLIFALLESENSDAFKVLKNSGADIALLKKNVEAKLGTVEKTAAGTIPTLSDDLKKLVTGSATDNLKELGANLIGTDNLVIAYAQSLDDKTSKETRIMVDNLITQAHLLNDKTPAKNTENTKTPFINQYTIDMTEMGRQGKYPAMGKDPNQLNETRRSELRRVLRVLGDDGNVAIVAGQGGGRSFMVEELARLSALPTELQPEAIRNKRFVKLNISAIIAGSKMRGDAEERIGNVLKEIARSKGKSGEIVLVIENVEDAMGSGKAGEGLDIASIISSSLERAELPGVIVTASEDEWKKKMEPNKKISSHYEPVFLDSPSKEEMWYVLIDKRPEFERRYGVTISDEALRAARDLSKKYLPELLDPKRSVEALRMACQIYKDARRFPPPVLQELRKKERALMADLEEYSDDNAFAARARAKIEKELATLRKTLRDTQDDFNQGLGLLEKLQSAEERINVMEAYLRFAEKKPIAVDNRAAYESEIAALKKEQSSLRPQLQGYQERYPNLSQQVTKAHVALHIEEKKKIPITDLLADDKSRLANMEARLAERVVGQPDAIKVVANAIRLLRTGFKDPNKPIFLSFEGESGVGKTELSKALAYVLFGDENAIIREDMEGYKEKHTVSRLLGAPPGYMGSDEGGQFTEKVRRRPYAVVLLDEIEEAHEDVRNAFLKAMDEGYIVTAAGIRVDVSNCIFIQTTNVTDENMAKVFPPKYLNRIDSRVRFRNLEEADLQKVFDIQLKPLVKRAADIAGIQLEVAPEVQKRLAEKSKETFGARELKRLISEHITSPLALAFVTGGEQGIHEGDTVTVRLSEDGKSFDFDVVGPGDCGAAAAAMAD